MLIKNKEGFFIIIRENDLIMTRNDVLMGRDRKNFNLTLLLALSVALNGLQFVRCLSSNCPEDVKIKSYHTLCDQVLCLVHGPTFS